jgi:hypothetical protein
MTSQSDFPTAAEGALAISVAQVYAAYHCLPVAAAPRKLKPTQADRNLASKEAAALEMASAAANKQARMEEADTFRGVHLDPNAHHWDEVRMDSLRPTVQNNLNIFRWRKMTTTSSTVQNRVCRPSNRPLRRHSGNFRNNELRVIPTTRLVSIKVKIRRNAAIVQRAREQGGTFRG